MLGFGSIGELALAEHSQITSADRWYRQLDTPPRTSLTQYAYAVALIASGTIIDPYILTQPEAVTIDRWQQPLEQPYPIPLRLETGSQQSLIAPDFRETVVGAYQSGWFRGLEQPFPIPQRLTTGSQQHVVYNPEYAIPIDRWQQPLSIPRDVAFGYGLQTGSQQDLVYTHVYSIPIDRWLQPLSEPAVYRALSYRALQVSEQMFYTAEPQPEDLDFRAWYSPLSEPTDYYSLAYRSFSVTDQQYLALTFDNERLLEPYGERAWYTPLSEPRLWAFKPHFPIASYQAFISAAEYEDAFYLFVGRSWLHSIHDGTVQLAASHHGSVMLHGVPDGDLPESA